MKGFKFGPLIKQHFSTRTRYTVHCLTLPYFEVLKERWASVLFIYCTVQCCMKFQSYVFFKQLIWLLLYVELKMIENHARVSNN